MIINTNGKPIEEPERFEQIDFKSWALEILGRFVNATVKTDAEGKEEMTITSLDLEKGRHEMARELKKSWKRGEKAEREKKSIVMP
jgi:hypothetical protein